MIQKIFDGFALAFSMLSIIPFFKVHHFFQGINGYSVMFYPLVGFILGIILWGFYTIVAPYVPQTHLLVLVFGLWVLLSGALHLDGFADSIDGFFVPKEKALEVMKDPHNGGMALLFSVVFLIIKASSVVALGSASIYLIPMVLLLSRFGVACCIYLCNYISQNGMGSLAKEEFGKRHFIVALTYTFVLVALFDAWSLLFVALVTFGVLAKIFTSRYGGFNGDMYGFSIELTELVLLNVIVVMGL